MIAPLPFLRTRNLGDIVRTNSVDGGFLDLALDRHFSAEEIERLATTLACEFRSRDHARGDRIAILGANGVPFLVAYLGVMRAGLVAVPINHRLPSETIQYILADSGAKSLIGDEERRGIIRTDIPTIEMESILSLGLGETHNTVITQSGEAAEILYTSGSTGRPKGVPLSHEGQLWALERFMAVSSHQAERTIIAAPMYHMNGLFFSTVCLALGYRTILMPSFEARAYLNAAAEHRCTMLSGIPTMFALMAREKELLAQLDLSSVKDIIIGSAPLTQALIDRVLSIFPNASVRNSYGTTETGPAMFGPHPQGLERPPLALGYPYPGVEWRLVGGTEQEGELETRTPATLDGYLNLPEATAAKLHEGWYRTGDIVRRDDQGFFYFVGRADDMFVCGGENVYPGEVEKLLERHPDILEAAVVAVADELKGMIPIAFVVPSPGRSIDPVAVREFSLQQGPAYAHPRIVIALDRMPVGGTHKVDKAALRPLAEAAARKAGRGV